MSWTASQLAYLDVAFAMLPGTTKALGYLSDLLTAGKSADDSKVIMDGVNAVEELVDSARKWKFDEVGLKGIKDIPSDAASDVLNKFKQGTEAVVDFIGPGGKFIRNGSNDVVVLSKDGTRRVRFDLNRPYPHNNPHTHVEELINGKWEKSGPIYPTDVPPN